MKTKVFISWSGEISRAVAEVLRGELPAIVRDIEPFMSQHDIDSGKRWFDDIVDKLDKTSFEAGALAKFKGQVAGLFIGGLKPSDFNNPLSQFQHRHFIKADVYRVITDIAKVTKEDLETVTKVFEKFWPDIENKYNEILKSTSESSHTPPRDSEDILEEVLLRQRGLETSVLEINSKMSNSSYVSDDDYNFQEIDFDVSYVSSKPIDLNELNNLISTNVTSGNKYLYVKCPEGHKDLGDSKTLRYTVTAQYFPNTYGVRMQIKASLERALVDFGLSFRETGFMTVDVRINGYRVQNNYG
jgi:hypothetical protein